MENIKFFVSGKWADKPNEPVFEVEQGEIRKVSYELAKVIVDSGKGERTDLPTEQELAELAEAADPVDDTPAPKGSPKTKKKAGRKKKPPIQDKENAESE